MPSLPLPTMTSTQIDARPDALDSEWDERATHWHCVLTYQGRRMTIYYSMGSAHTKPPEIGDVLECLFLDASYYDGQSFEDFCADSGYSDDSRKAERIYKACRSTGIRLRKLLGEDLDAINNQVNEANQ